MSNEAPRSEAVMAIYRERLHHLKMAQAHSVKGEIPKAVERYKRYLKALATYYGVEEERISPKLFDPVKDLTEMFLISHAYWDLAKAYDRAPSLRKETIRFLDQFTNFTIGYKYQNVNYRMIKKYTRKNICHNPELFAKAQKEIQVKTKGCFIATMVYGQSSPQTQFLRQQKVWIVEQWWGPQFIDIYYFLSPKLVSFFESRPRPKEIFINLCARPILETIIRLSK